MRNLEIKAIAPDLGRLRRALTELGARREPPPLVQTDWYFVTPLGRLKLRQRRGSRTAELILYARPDAAKARTSEFQVLTVADVPGMLRLLRAMFMPGACVRKRRDLWLYGDTRVHLDRVAGLGTFVEIEVPCARSQAGARRVMALLRGRLGIGESSVVACSYADLPAGRSDRSRLGDIGSRSRTGARRRR